MRRADIPEFRQAATYALPAWKVVYISNPKAACTSIKWLLAELLGLDDNTFLRTLELETTRATTIHRNRGGWAPGAPTLPDLSDAELAEITPANGWFLFTVTRNPASRLWSAWQSKLLLREPEFSRRVAEEPWFPRVPRTSEDVFEDWHRFIQHVKDGMHPQLVDDAHFQPQTKLLGIPGTPYDRVYDTGEIGLLLKDLAEHLSRAGWDQPLVLRGSNETPLPPLRALFSDDVLAVIHDHYRADYELLPYEPGVPAKAKSGRSYSDDLVATVGLIVQRHERIADLCRLSKDLKTSIRMRSEQAGPREPGQSGQDTRDAGEGGHDQREDQGTAHGAKGQAGDPDQEADTR